MRQDFQLQWEVSWQEDRCMDNNLEPGAESQEGQILPGRTREDRTELGLGENPMRPEREKH